MSVVWINIELCTFILHVALSSLRHFTGAVAEFCMEQYFWLKRKRKVFKIGAVQNGAFPINVFVCTLRMPLVKWCMHTVHFILMRHLFAYPLLLIFSFFYCPVCKSLCVVVVHYAACFPHSSFCAHVYANEECVSEIKNLLAHISVSRPAILDQPCCFLHIIETSLRLFNLYIRMTYRWACVFITVVTAWGERARKKKKKTSKRI